MASPGLSTVALRPVLASNPVERAVPAARAAIAKGGTVASEVNEISPKVGDGGSGGVLKLA